MHELSATPFATHPMTASPISPLYRPSAALSCNTSPKDRGFPGAFATHTEQQLLENTRQIVWPQIVSALTIPITQAEKNEAEKADHGDIRDDVFYGVLNESPEQTPIQIYDAAGKLVGSAMNTFNLRSLPDGVYMVRVAGYKGAYKITR